MVSASSGSVARKKRALTVDDVTLIETKSLKRTITATALGNAMEWFDFGVYAYLATIIGRVFFPGGDPTIQLLASFGAFAAAFLVRPIGGLILGPLGDKLGRQKVLAFTMIMMAGSTFCIGLIPSYNSIGVWAPILLLALRLVQGFSTGGEFGGAMTYLGEHAPDRIRGFLSSWLEFGTLFGYVVAALLAAVLTSTLSDEALLDWGWRIPFFVAGPLGIVGLYMRMKLEETPAFEEHKKTAEVEESAARELVTMVSGHWRPMLLCIGLVIVYMVGTYMVLSYLPTYLSSELGHSADMGNYLLIALMVVMMIIQPFAGMASDKWGRRPVIFTGCLGFLLFSIPAFWLLHSDSLALVFLGLLMLGVFQNCFMGAMPSTLPALFSTSIRYGAIAIALNFSTSLFGGTTPLVSTGLIDLTGSDMMPAYYMMIVAIIGMLVILVTAESSRKPLQGSKPAASDREEAKELLADHHQDIAERIRDVDSQIAELQKIRADLADQHPSIR